MKLLSFSADGKPSLARSNGDGVVTLNDQRLATQPSRRAGRGRDGGAAPGAPRAPRPTAGLPRSNSSRSIPNPAKIFCAGVNYRSHAAEVGRELPEQPSMFIRFTDTLVGHDGEMIRPTLVGTTSTTRASCRW